VARQTPTQKIQRWAKKIEMPSPKGLSKAGKRLKKLDPRPRGLERVRRKLQKIEMPSPRGLNRVSDKLKRSDVPKASSKASRQLRKADAPSPRELSRKTRRRMRREAVEARVRPKKRRRRSLRKRLVRFGTATSLGAFLMYLLDPEHGQARREKMSKKLDETLSSNLDKNKKSGTG
jgi:hypothetical protein